MKNITTILFDLDGTLLPMDAKKFESLYLGTLGKFTSAIIDPELMLKSLYKGQVAMITSSDDTKTNGEVFFETFETLVGTDTKASLMEVLDEYYLTDFGHAKEATSQSQEMVDAVEYLKEKDKTIILATNPILPRIATDRRIKWAGFKLDDFKDITRFEENHFCKPNLDYYREILEDNNLVASECLMIGNDVEEDLIAAELGMKTWLIEDDLIHREDDVKCDWRGTRQEFLKKIKEVF